MRNVVGNRQRRRREGYNESVEREDGGLPELGNGTASKADASVEAEQEFKSLTLRQTGLDSGCIHESDLSKISTDSVRGSRELGRPVGTLRCSVVYNRPRSLIPV